MCWVVVCLCERVCVPLWDGPGEGDVGEGASGGPRNVLERMSENVNCHHAVCLFVLKIREIGGSSSPVKLEVLGGSLSGIDALLPRSQQGELEALRAYEKIGGPASRRALLTEGQDLNLCMVPSLTCQE